MANYKDRYKGNGDADHDPKPLGLLALGRELSRNEERESKDRERDRDRDRGVDCDKDKDMERDRDTDRDGLRDRHWERSIDINEDEEYCYKSRWWLWFRSILACLFNNGRRDYYYKDKEDKHSSRSGSPSRASFHHRSKSHSCSVSQSESKSTSEFGMALPETPMLPGVAAVTTVVGQLPVVTPSVPGMMFPLTAPEQSGALSVTNIQAMAQQATRHARRVYVGGLPPTANEQSVAMFFSHVMATIGGNTAGPGDAVVNVYINHEKKFAFVEMRSVEEANNAMALNGIVFKGAPVKVRRPSDYNPSLAATYGPNQPIPSLNLTAVGLTPGSGGGGGHENPDRIFVGRVPCYFTGVQETPMKVRRPSAYHPSLAAMLGPSQLNPNLKVTAVRLTSGSAGGLVGLDIIFVGGVPHYFTEVQVRELLETLGSLRVFVFVKDRETGNSEGYAFCVYQDLSVTDIACQALNGFKMGDKTLIVRRANQCAQESSLLHQLRIVLQRTVLNPTKVVCLMHCLSLDELINDDDYEDIMEDMRQEGGRLGSLVNVVIPRPGPNGEQIPGVGKVFLEYSDVKSSAKAMAGMHGRKFGGKQVEGVFYPENKFYQGEYDG